MPVSSRMARMLARNPLLLIPTRPSRKYASRGTVVWSGLRLFFRGSRHDGRPGRTAHFVAGEGAEKSIAPVADIVFVESLVELAMAANPLVQRHFERLADRRADRFRIIRIDDQRIPELGRRASKARK